MTAPTDHPPAVWRRLYVRLRLLWLVPCILVGGLVIGAVIAIFSVLEAVNDAADT